MVAQNERYYYLFTREKTLHCVAIASLSPEGVTGYDGNFLPTLSANQILLFSRDNFLMPQPGNNEAGKF